MFADDTNALLSGSDIHALTQTINNEINKVPNWLETNKLALNMNKTNFFHFLLLKGRKQITFDVNIHLFGTQLGEEQSAKFLDIYMLRIG